MRQRLITALLFSALELRARTVVPVQAGWRRLMIALSSGAKQTEHRAARAWFWGDAVGAMQYWRELEKEQPNRAAWPLKISQAASECGEFDTAESTLRDAIARGIKDERVELALLRHSRLNRRSNAALGEAETAIADPNASSAKLFYSAFYLLAHNQLESARAGLERVLSDKNLAPLARGNIAAVDLLKEARAQGRPDVPGWVSTAESSTVVRHPASDTLVVIFVLPSGALGLSMNALHAMLSSTGVNALHLYDSRQVLHLAGTDRFGRGYQAMLDGIRALATEMGVRRLITIGSSATGYTAIRVAMDLGADGALVFSPATLMLADANPAVARSAHTLQRLRHYALPMMQNLRQLIAARTAGPRIEVYFSASNRRDIMHANNIAGLPGVILHPVGGHARHDCMTEMASRGYRNLLTNFEAR